MKVVHWVEAKVSWKVLLTAEPKASMKAEQKELKLVDLKVGA